MKVRAFLLVHEIIKRSAQNSIRGDTDELFKKWLEMEVELQ